MTQQLKTAVAAIRTAQAELAALYLDDFALGLLQAKEVGQLRKQVQRLQGDFPDLHKRADSLGLFDEVQND